MTELDLFNAKVRLALARVARFPGDFPAFLASEVGLLGWQLEPRVDPAEYESIGGVLGTSIFSIYRNFWAHFPVELDLADQRIIVNLPSPKALTNKGATTQVRTDHRLGALHGLPFWPVEAGDITLFSEDGWSDVDQERLAATIQLGMTVTVLRINEACDFWLQHCRVGHHFGQFFDCVERRAVLQRVYEGSLSDPVIVTIFGVQALKL